MNKLLDLLIASFAFVRALFTRRDPVKNYSQGGHALLEGWDHAPEEEIIRRAGNASRKSVAPAAVALYGYAGPALGELIPLRGPFLTVGTEITNHVVLTPDSKAGTCGPYPFEIADGITVSAPAGQRVRVNGREEERCDLYDYDRIELGGNHFLVMEMGR